MKMEKFKMNKKKMGEKMTFASHFATLCFVHHCVNAQLVLILQMEIDLNNNGRACIIPLPMHTPFGLFSVLEQQFVRAYIDLSFRQHFRFIYVVIFSEFNCHAYHHILCRINQRNNFSED